MHNRDTIGPKKGVMGATRAFPMTNDKNGFLLVATHGLPRKKSDKAEDLLRTVPKYEQFNFVNINGEIATGGYHFASSG